jgi:hypothetical protein
MHIEETQVITGSRMKEKWTNNVVVDREFVSCEQNDIWPVHNSLHTALKRRIGVLSPGI